MNRTPDQLLKLYSCTAHGCTPKFGKNILCKQTELCHQMNPSVNQKCLCESTLRHNKYLTQSTKKVLCSDICLDFFADFKTTKFRHHMGLILRFLLELGYLEVLKWKSKNTYLKKIYAFSKLTLV